MRQLLATSIVRQVGWQSGADDAGGVLPAGRDIFAGCVTIAGHARETTSIHRSRHNKTENTGSAYDFIEIIQITIPCILYLTNQFFEFIDFDELLLNSKSTINITSPGLRAFVPPE